MKVKIINQHDNSSKYGNCEICGKYVSEMHTADFDAKTLMLTSIQSIWGHYKCLKKFIKKLKRKLQND